LRFGQALVWLAVIEFSAGCYQLKPAGGAGPVPGTRMALELNDQGRLGLGGSIGPEITQVEGRLISSDKDEYLLAVMSVRFVRGGSQVWSGEKVRIKSEYVSQAFERHLSKSRTAVLSAVVLGGVTYVIITRNLFGFAADEPALPPDTISTSFRIPRLPRP